MPNERRQFRILYRDFLVRIVDLEVLSSHGEIERLLVQMAAMLAAFSFVCAILLVPRYGWSTLPWERLQVAAWGDEEFLISSTIGIVGLFAVLAWNAVLPSRGDCLVLGILPVRTRTIFVAKIAAIGSALGVAVAATNLFTGFGYPFAIAQPNTGLLGTIHAFGAYWVTMGAAALFVFSSLLAVQGVAAQLLSFRLFLRVSSFLQLGALFLILSVYFLTPPIANPHGLAAPENQRLLDWLPSFWFLGLFQKLNNSPHAIFGPLVARAVRAVLVSFSAASLSYVLAYRRNLRRIIEQPDIAPGDRSRPATRIGAFLAARLLTKSIDRAVVLFTARTLARSRQHRLLLAAYTGVGLAISLVYAKDVLYGYTNTWSISRTIIIPWRLPNVPMVVPSLVLLFFAVVGARAVFALPMALKANWIFRLTEVHKPADYFAGVRKAMLVLTAAPVCIAAVLIYPAIWPAQPALQHVAVLVVLGVLLVETSLYGFRKIPFACSYLPGKSNLKLKLSAYGALLLFVCDQGAHLELWTIQKWNRSAVLLTILLAAAVRSAIRTARNSREDDIVFEDVANAELSPLDLHSDFPRDGGASTPDAGLKPALPSFSQVIPPGAVLFAPAAETNYFREEIRTPISTHLEQCLQDLRAGARIVTKSPWFSAAAIALIALGIGGNATIYSVVHSVLSKPAPGITAKGLVKFGVEKDGRPLDPGENSFRIYADYAANSRTMQSIAAAMPLRSAVVVSDSGSSRFRGLLVTGNYFDTLGVRLLKGRLFTPDEVRGAAPLAAIITYSVWQLQFQGGDVLGQPILLNGYPATVVGVTPPKFHGTGFAPNLEICVPLAAYRRLEGRIGSLEDRDVRGVEIYGRLAPGYSLSAARAEFDGLSAGLESAFPEFYQGRRILLEPYAATTFGPNSGPQARGFMAILMAVALLTLLIVCANVANLMLTRSVARQRETAIRLSMGASRMRILRLALAEGLVLALAAAAASWCLALWVTRVIGGLVPPLQSGARLEIDLTPDWRVAAYALLLALLSALAFTAAPALRASREALLPLLKVGENSSDSRSWMTRALVVMQLALCVVLLISAGLASRSLSLVDAVDLYFDRDHVLLAGVTTGTDRDEPVALLERVRERLLSVPGVVAASWAVAAPPHSHPWMGAPVQAAGSNEQAVADLTLAGPSYLRTLAVPILAGRDFSQADTNRQMRAAVINQKLAEALWPGRSAFGQSIVIEGGAPVEVVGVVPNGAFNGVGIDGSFSGLGKSGRRPFVYLMDRASPGAPTERTFHLRYTGDLKTLVPAVRLAIRQVDSRMTVFDIRTMETEWETFTSPIRFITGLLDVFGVAALLLASVGLYAVAAFYTTRRTRELGIRMALGATPRQAMQSILRDGLLLTAIGAGTGLALCIALGRLFASLLFGVSPTDARTYLGVMGMLAIVSLTACYIPARRAAHVDPMQALRQE